MKTLQFIQFTLGCDPEFFFSKSGKIIGAEKIISKKGLILTDYSSTKVIVDGVLAELNPIPCSCRQDLGHEISRCFEAIKNVISSDPSLGVDFSQKITLTKKELDSLSDESKKFGCAPSNNVYSKQTNSVKVKENTFKPRVAGGHIHLGHSGIKVIKDALDNPDRVIPMLDVLLGNSCVLIDKDPNAKNRRRLYGKAGEYRTPAHGLEYRTLSNFWLKSYPLMSFVMGMARLAVLMVASDKDNGEYEKKILDKVNLAKIKRAINNNDYHLAYENFLDIEKSLLEITNKNSNGNQNREYPICDSNIKQFKYFISKPLDYWFKDNPVDHWIKYRSEDGNNVFVRNHGWENFINKIVNKDMKSLQV